MKSLDSGMAYYVKTNNEFAVDHLIEGLKIKTIDLLVVNSLSKIADVFLLPKYLEKNINKLTKEGYKKSISVGSPDFLKFLINREMQEHSVLIMGLVGLGFEAEAFLKTLLKKIACDNNCNCLLIEYCSDHSDLLMEVIDD